MGGEILQTLVHFLEHFLGQIRKPRSVPRAIPRAIPQAIPRGNARAAATIRCYKSFVENCQRKGTENERMCFVSPTQMFCIYPRKFSSASFR